MTTIKLESDDRRYGDTLQRFRVRASVEFSFAMEVGAHDSNEASIIAEHFCEATSGDWWQRMAENVRKSFEPEAIGSTCVRTP